MAQALEILIVDDDAPLREMLERSFTREGHQATAVADGEQALARTAGERFDIVLLDVALGAGPSGYDVCRSIRARRDVTPIIMLTALDSEADAVLGLEAGADDYVTKPFGLAELRSRIRAVMRRATNRVVDDGVLRIGAVALDRRNRAVERDGEAVKLTFSEFELLSCLMDRPGACSAARSCCARSGGTRPTGTRGRSTSTSATCARSSRRSPSSPRSS
jgi:DNA-binding response OmpR family regulator